METNKPTKRERYVAASAYLFDLGYFIAWLTRIDSEFTKFHLRQADRIIKMVLLPGLVIWFAGILWQNPDFTLASTFVIYLGTGLVAISIIQAIVGAWHALKGRKKKMV